MEARGAWASLAAGLLGGILCLTQVTARYHSPYPPITASVGSTETVLEDIMGVALGLRRAAADLAWIQTLQYYGTPEEGQSELEFENGLGNYPRFLAHAQRAAHIDPHFTYVYYYGGAVLGWNLNRLPEAELLLKEGIAKNRQEWRLSQYLAGLAYEKDHDIAKLTLFLESVVLDPNCPILMKTLLANLYKKQRQYDKALKMWQVIYDSGDPPYMNRAVAQTREIMRLRHHPPP